MDSYSEAYELDAAGIRIDECLEEIERIRICVPGMLEPVLPEWTTGRS
jgi:hypothetical protein